MKYYPQFKENLVEYLEAPDPAHDLIYMFDEEDWIELDKLMSASSNEQLYGILNILSQGPFDEAKDIIFKFVRSKDKDISEEASVTLGEVTDIHEIPITELPNDIKEIVCSIESEWDEVINLQERLA